MQNKIKIAIIISHPIQHFCPQYVSFSENKNIELKVFFGSTLGFKKYIDVNFKQEISWSNLNLDKFNHVFLNGEAMLQSDKNLDAPTLELELDKFEPQILIINGYFQKLQRRARKWGIKNKVHIAFIADSELKHTRSSLKEVLKKIYLRWYFSKINSFLSVGNANEAYYKNYGVSNDKLLRMHFPIDLKQYSACYLNKKILRSEIRNQHNINQDELVLLVVGKLVAWKNQDHIIDAMALLEKEGFYLNLFILGSGDMKEAWQQKAAQLNKSKVHFSGFVNIEGLPAYYAATDIYVHPASLEPHSIAISEAIMMACPIIVSDRCGSYGETDDVQEGKNGYVYEFGNLPQLANKIKMLAQDIDKLKQFGEYSHKIAAGFQNIAHYTIVDKLIKKYDDDFK